MFNTNIPTDLFLYDAHYWNFFKTLPLIKVGDRLVYLCGSADGLIMIIL